MYIYCMSNANEVLETDIAIQYVANSVSYNDVASSREEFTC